MADKPKEDKVVLEREYVVPLRKRSMSTPQYKRTPKAVKVLKEFIAKHMKVEARDTRLVKLDKNLNLEMWARGIRKPMNKIKVKVKKFESGIVNVELAEIPEFLKFKMDKEKKAQEKSVSAKPSEKPAEKVEEKTEAEKKVEDEKKKSEIDAGLKSSEKQAKEMKHTQTREKPQVHRMALQK